MNQSNYKTILFHLITKVKRNADYYRKIARGIRFKAAQAADHDEVEAGQLSVHADSLARCADDMDYTYRRATERLTPEEIEEMLDVMSPRDVLQT
jgi:hypothetical protein